MKQKTRKQTAAALVVTSAPLLYYGISNFEAGASAPLEAVAISIGCTGGLSCLIGGIYMLFKKDRGVVLASQTNVGDSSVEKEIINKNKVNEMAKPKTNTSVDLMKREKELETRRKELESLLAEVTKEEKAVEKELLSKGWVQKNGSWGIK